MPTKKDILTFAVDKELLKQLEDFRKENHIWTRSEAIRRLLHEALKKYKKSTADKS
jgi:metal-responsive CopG/Arc/MetJ family transcriptional regulator